MAFLLRRFGNFIYSKGTAYNYPQWVNLVFGKILVFDKSKEKLGMPAPAQSTSPNKSSGTLSKEYKSSTHTASVPLVSMQQDGQLGYRSTELTSPNARASDFSQRMGCGPVKSDSSSGRSLYIASCPTGADIIIDCGEIPCKSSIK